MKRSVDIRLTRRAALLGAAAAVAASGASKAPGERRRVPVIDITDLYHPYQDPGDNFDLIAAYALPEIDLRAVILDPTEGFRAEVATAGDGSKHGGGPRDAGIIPVMQLNYLFDRNVAWGIGPFLALKSPTDKALDAPAFQQSGIELILETLRASRERAVWETALWIEASGRRLVRNAVGVHRIVTPGEVGGGDRVLTNELLPCTVTVRDDGGFTFARTERETNFSIYHRGDWRVNEAALREALPALYASFSCRAKA